MTLFSISQGCKGSALFFNGIPRRAFCPAAAALAAFAAMQCAALEAEPREALDAASLPAPSASVAPAFAPPAFAPPAPAAPLPHSGILSTALDSAFVANYARALETHPAIAAAIARERAALNKTGALAASFATPVLSASAGYSSGVDDVPGISLPRIAPQDAVALSAGVEAPVAKGVYAGAGAAQRFLTDTPEADAQTALGARVRVPLLRDFGHALNERELSKLRAAAAAAAAETALARASLSREIFLAWNLLLRAEADAEAVASAEQRAEKLLEETSERARSQDVAGYQVFPAQYEVALRKEELLDARQNAAARLETLRERLGLAGDESGAAVSRGATNAIFAAANSIIRRKDLAFPAAEALRASPARLAAAAKLAAAEAALQALVEDSRDTLDFTAGAGFRGEAESGLIGSDNILAKDSAVFEAALVYKRPLGRGGADAEIAAAKAEVEACEADLAAAKNEILAELARAQTGFAAACARLSLALEAIGRAGAALDAEESRFNLGEGTSRNVLDAQKDLTNATRRGIAVAGAVADSFAELLHAAGFDPAQAFEADE